MIRVCLIKILLFVVMRLRWRIDSLLLRSRSVFFSYHLWRLYMLLCRVQWSAADRLNLEKLKKGNR